MGQSRLSPNGALGDLGIIADIDDTLGHVPHDGSSPLQRRFQLSGREGALASLRGAKLACGRLGLLQIVGMPRYRRSVTRTQKAHAVEAGAVLLVWGSGSCGPADGLQVAGIGQVGRVVVGGGEVAVVFRGRPGGVGVGGVVGVRHVRGRGRGDGRRCLVVEVHAHAEPEGSLESAGVDGRADIVVVVDPADARRVGEVCVDVRARVARGAGRDFGDGDVARVSELAAGCYRARLAQEVAAAVAEGAAVLGRRMVVLIVVVGRAVEVSQRY